MLSIRAHRNTPGRRRGVTDHGLDGMASCLIEINLTERIVHQGPGLPHRRGGSDNDRLGFQHDVETLRNIGDDLMRQRKHISPRRPAAIDQYQRLLLMHAGCP